MTELFQPVIRCGGSDAPLWPLSYPTFPEQFREVDIEHVTAFLEPVGRRARLETTDGGLALVTVGTTTDKTWKIGDRSLEIIEV